MASHPMVRRWCKSFVLKYGFHRRFIALRAKIVHWLTGICRFFETINHRSNSRCIHLIVFLFLFPLRGSIYLFFKLNNLVLRNHQKLIK